MTSKDILEMHQNAFKKCFAHKADIRHNLENMSMRIYVGNSEHGLSFIKCAKVKLCKINARNEVGLYSVLENPIHFPSKICMLIDAGFHAATLSTSLLLKCTSEIRNATELYKMRQLSSRLLCMINAKAIRNHCCMLHWNLSATDSAVLCKCGKLTQSLENLGRSRGFYLIVSIWVHTTELEAISSSSFQSQNVHYRVFCVTGSILDWHFNYKETKEMLKWKAES